MGSQVKRFIQFIKCHSNEHNKSSLISLACSQFQFTKDRSVYFCDFFAVRFCQSKGKSFSNTVLSLSALQKYDTIPFLVVLVSTTQPVRMFLTNSTFINKASHSSQHLSQYNIRGSFNGSDIIKEPFGITNDIDHVEELFAFHVEIGWSENFIRIINKTKEITPKGTPFIIDDTIRNNIYQSIERAKSFINSTNFKILQEDLDKRVQLSKDAIICAAHIENVNIRGRLIEALITADEDERKRITEDLRTVEESLPIYGTKNELGDYSKFFENGKTYTDIKTKVIYLDSNPKAYNVDKFLEVMSDNSSVFFFYFIGLDENFIVNKILCSVYHNYLIDNTVTQFHWAGRNSRGVTQFIGKAINEMLINPSFSNHIDECKAKSFLDQLIDNVNQ